jgi:glutamate decarboxylase
MVHLNRVVTDAEIKDGTKDLVKGFKTFKLDGIDEEPDDFTATVYGSRYAAEDLPKHEMPVCNLAYGNAEQSADQRRIARCLPRC